MTAGEFCNRQVVIARGDESVIEAARRMRELHVGDLIVLDAERRPIGILTDRDITVGVVAQSPEHIDSLRVEDVMTRAPITAREAESLDDALKRMRSYGIRRMPVVDDAGTLQGLLTFDDLVAVTAEELTDLSELVLREQDRENERRSFTGRLGKERYRLIVIGRKKLPTIDGDHERNWGFVQKVGRKPEEIEDELDRFTYPTATRGERHL